MSSSRPTTTPQPTVPLTTVFTPPPSCSSFWTYEGELYNGVPGGLLMQNLYVSQYDTACWPISFTKHARGPGSMIYSPGVCPHGYTIPTIMADVSITTAICCLSNYPYTTTPGPNSLAGCVSMLPSGSGTNVKARSNTSAVLNSTSVTGPLTMWAQPITIEFQASDLSLFPTTTTTTKAGAVISPKTLSPGPTSPTPTSDPSNAQQSSSSLSSGAIAGAVVGTVGAIALSGILALVIFHKRRKQRQTETIEVETAAKELATEKDGDTKGGGNGLGDLQVHEVMGSSVPELETRPHSLHIEELDGRQVDGAAGLHETDAQS